MNAATSSLAALSIDTARAVAQTAPGVVYVDAHPRRDASGIAWDDHHIVTVEHAVERDDDIEVILGSGATVGARLVGRDPSLDIALLRVEEPIAALERAPASDLAAGHIVLALGRDEDGAIGASFGIVSSHDGAWRTWRGGDVDRFIKPDLNVYPGFSGGPLIDSAGALVGMNTWGLSRRSALTLPVATIERAVGALLGGKRMTRGYLGLAMQSVRLPQTLRRTIGRPQTAAAIVVDVASGGPADRAGVMIGDVILGLGSQTIEDSDDVQRALGPDAVGREANLVLVRGGELRDVAVTIGERPGDDE